MASKAEVEADVIEAAKDLVHLWQNQKIAGLARAERNTAIEETRNSLISAVKMLEAMPR